MNTTSDDWLTLSSRLGDIVSAEDQVVTVAPQASHQMNTTSDDWLTLSSRLDDIVSAEDQVGVAPQASYQINTTRDDWYALSSRLDDIVPGEDQVVTVAPRASPELIAFAKDKWHTPSRHLDEKIVLPDRVVYNIITPKPKPTAFTNYDILFAPPSSSSSPDRKDQEYTLVNHVGNRRFLVLLNIYRPRYAAADEQDDEVECMRIVLEIIKTVRQVCAPHGRFLQQDANSNQWFEIDDVATLIRIVERELTRNFCSSEDEERPVKRARTTTLNNFELFCEVVARTGVVAKKNFPRDGSQVDKPKPFDVICNSNWISLQENADHVGNNRLQVILDMRLKNFKASSQEDRKRIINDIVSAIIDDSGSHFLSLHVSSGQYMPLSRESAAMCIKNALDGKLAITDQQKPCSSEANLLVSRNYKKRLFDKVERRNNVLMHKIPIHPMRLSYNPKAA